MVLVFGRIKAPTVAGSAHDRGRRSGIKGLISSSLKAVYLIINTGAIS
jgi:hypothetical protein